MSDAEISLSGGRVTQGVVRVGQTVRRPATENSGFVRRLLSQLADCGFDGAPAALGTDDRGRDIFEYVEGEVPAELGFYGDDTLRQAAGLIRRFHDASVTLVTKHADIEVICHNDLSPCNFVFRDRTPVAIIDFDAAAPGSRASDLGYAAWLWLNLGLDEIEVAEQARRMAIFTNSYGMFETQIILAAVLARQSMLADHGRRLGDTAMTRWAIECRNWTRRNLKALGGQ